MRSLKKMLLGKEQIGVLDVRVLRSVKGFECPSRRIVPSLWLQMKRSLQGHIHLAHVKNIRGDNLIAVNATSSHLAPR